MKIDRLLDDHRRFLKIEGSSFNENHDVLSYAETYWVEMTTFLVRYLLQERSLRDIQHPVYRQKERKPDHDPSIDLCDSQSLELVSEIWYIGPTRIIEEPALSFSITINDTYYNFLIGEKKLLELNF